MSSVRLSVLIRSCVYHEGARLFQQLSGLELLPVSPSPSPSLGHGIESLGGGDPAGRLWRMRQDNLPSLSSSFLFLCLVVVSENFISNFLWNVVVDFL